MTSPACDKYGCTETPVWKVKYQKQGSTEMKERKCCQKHFAELIGKRDWLEVERIRN